ncbi:MAG: hypothetical protein E3J83_03320 [Candidatus Atribacteria bacterium]|nr:MAG: hypothetical protein E3J83_03320 [Candidatus Atribacteria bacterium]
MTERKRLKAVRRRKAMVKSFNFETKTLARAIPIYQEDTQTVKNAKVRHDYHNKAMRKKRG